MRPHLPSFQARRRAANRFLGGYESNPSAVSSGSVAALFGAIALPAVLLVLPAPWGDRIGRFTLLYAARQVASLHPQTGLFSPALSMLVLLAWPAAALVAAAVLITRHDT